MSMALYIPQLTIHTKCWRHNTPSTYGAYEACTVHTAEVTPTAASSHVHNDTLVDLQE